MKIAGLIFQTDIHHLDHIAPLCKILDAPLIVTEDLLSESALKYYPNLDIHHYPPLEAPEALVQNFDLIVSCYPRQLFDEFCFLPQALLNKKVATVWVPHGNSDKGRNHPFMEALQNETLALVYGKQMATFLKEKDVFAKTVSIGNFRYHFYREHQAFYLPLIEKEIFSKLKRGKKTILYAPTWQDSENSSSFASACPLLLKNLPPDYNLIVKPHPHLFQQQKGLLEELIMRFGDRPNILFLNHFPPIYPLLDHIDIYIGDMSSIGYDFIRFNRPLFFLNENRRDAENDLGFFLAKCGHIVEKEEYETIFLKIEKHEKLSKEMVKIQKQMVKYTFSTLKNLSTLKETLERKICCH